MRALLARLDRALRQLDLARKRQMTVAVVAVGALAAFYYFSWWFYPVRPLGPWEIAAGIGMLFYATVQIFFSWYAYLRIEIPAARPAPAGLRVDVLVPVYRESFEIVESSLRAAVQIEYPHRTWLLDDDGREELRELAARFGAEYVRRTERKGEKAGNVNHALALLEGDFVTIFDVDHVAEPWFLDRVLGHFDDPGVGFVQALVAHRNQLESFVARAASGQADDVFGPSSMGWNGCGAALAWGAHCTFRRSALQSIGGYRIGLAEDLLTSLALHGAGWKSLYIPSVVARGLVPADLSAYFVQHFKWSSGVLGTLVGGGLGGVVRLRPSQAVCYLTRMTYYLLGPLVFGHLLLLIWALLTGAFLWAYFYHALTLGIAAIVVRKVVGAMWERDPKAGWQLIGTALALSSWPVYLLSFVGALGGVRVPHLPTPKDRRGGNFTLLVLPQLAACAALLVGVVVALRRGPTASNLTRATAALGVIAFHLVAFWGVVEGWRRRRHGALPAE